MLGNVCLILAALISGALISSVNTYKAPLGGSGGAEAFPIWILLLHIGIACTLGVATIAITAHGGFDWIPLHRFVRFLLLGIGLLLAIATSLMSAGMLKQTNRVAYWLGIFLQYGYFFIPVILIASGFILNNAFLREAIPPALYQWPLAVVLGISLMTFGAGIWEWLHEKSADEKDRAYESKPAMQAMRIQEIEAADITQQMVRVLEFTRSVYPLEVQKKAVAKIMTHPKWQTEIINMLENEQSRNVMPFLATADIADKKVFIEPVRKGLLSVAADIRHDIQGTSPSQMSKDMFSEYVHTVLSVVEKFEGAGVDYLPAVREIRAALDEPHGEKPVRFHCVGVLEDWLKKRK